MRVLLATEARPVASGARFNAVDGAGRHRPEVVQSFGTRIHDCRDCTSGRRLPPGLPPRPAAPPQSPTDGRARASRRLWRTPGCSAYFRVVVGGTRCPSAGLVRWDIV